MDLPSPHLPVELQLRMLRSQATLTSAALAARGERERALAARADAAESDSVTAAGERDRLRRALGLAERAQTSARAAVDAALQRETAARAAGAELSAELLLLRDRERRAVEARAPEARVARNAAAVGALTASLAAARSELAAERAAREGDAARAGERSRALERHVEALSSAFARQLQLIDVLRRKCAHLEVAATLAMSEDEWAAARAVNGGREARTA